MSENRQRYWLVRCFVVVAAVTTAIFCMLSYLGDSSCREQFAAGGQIDLLEPNLNEHWSVFGALSAKEARLKQTGDGVVELEVPANAPSWSDVSSGVIYKVGLFSPGWYEFSGEFRAEVNEAAGIGALLEVHCSRWRFLTKADPGPGDAWKKTDVYFRPAYPDPSADISCRLWGAGGGHSRKVFFRNMRLTKIASNPPLGEAQFDLEKKEEARLGKPAFNGNASYGGAMLAVLLLAMMIGVSWRWLE